MNKKILFNNDWHFAKFQIGESLENIFSLDEEKWQEVTLPHDWAIEDVSYFYESCEGWYKKNYEFEHDIDELVYLKFEGVYMDCTIFINKKPVYEWKYGYSTFEFDITPHIQKGNNEIMVQVVFQTPNSRWYSGAGIYRNVWLKTVPQSHIESDGIYISTDDNIVNIDTQVNILKTDTDNYYINSTILDKNNKVVATNKTTLSSDICTQTLKVTDNIPWTIDNPYCYTLICELCNTNETIQKEECTFGFRTLKFDCNEGFFLNNKHIKLKGVCEHNDLGCLGSAINKTALKRRLGILKEMGANAIRASHNMPAVELLDLADEMGFLVVNEAFDMWELSKTTYDYARFFNEWVEKDVASWIRRDRNHPCIIMWSIGNEIFDTHVSERGYEITKQLVELVNKYEYKKNAPTTFGSNYMPWENTQKCAELVDLVGYNYGENLYGNHHEKHPNWIIYGSETSSTVQSRGVYHFPLKQDILADDDKQCSSLGNSSTSWGAKNTETCILTDLNTNFSLGMFIWSGFDYIGEPTPYHTKNSYFGQIDTAGFKKDTFYIYQAAWTDYKTAPMIHVFPYWDFNEGQLIDVRICSNAPFVKLCVNGISYGIVELKDTFITTFSIPYEKGHLTAYAYDENNSVIKTKTIFSFGDTVSLLLETDKTILKADSDDLAFISISALDKKSRFVANASDRINVTVLGAGKLVGLDNGDSTDNESYKSNTRKLSNGKLLAVIAPLKESGDIIVCVSLPGICTKTIMLSSGKVNYDIPVRKIALLTTTNTFSPDERQITVYASIYPKNASYKELIWKAVTTSGVETNIAKVVDNGDSATITALGDGDFRLRCMCKNGTDTIKVISELEFIASNLGQAFIDPYVFVSSSLKTGTGGLIRPGNERGVSFDNECESYITFENIDFGEYGSDTITLPIFELSDKPTYIEIWEGIPHQKGASKLDTLLYHKEHIWNVYQDETYTLSKRLKGITTLSILSYSKIHLQGFFFEKQNKSYAKLSILDNNEIYGDTFTIKSDCIEHIGNNVSILFDNMDFSEKSVSKLTICGNSHIEKNIIHVLFTINGNDTRQIVEFSKTKDYEEKIFDLDTITGNAKVTFVFLPGSNFDFKWFKFE